MKNAEYLIDVYLGFENHAPFNVAGTLGLEVYNDEGEYIGSGTQVINVPPGTAFSEPVTVHVEDPLKYTGSGYILISFESPTLGFLNLGRINYG